MTSDDGVCEIVRVGLAWSGRREAALVRLIHNGRVVPREDRMLDSGIGRVVVEFPSPPARVHRVAATLSFIGETFENLAATVEIDGQLAATLRAPRAEHRWELSLAAARGSAAAAKSQGHGDG